MNFAKIECKFTREQIEEVVKELLEDMGETMERYAN